MDLLTLYYTQNSRASEDGDLFDAYELSTQRMLRLCIEYNKMKGQPPKTRRIATFSVVDLVLLLEASIRRRWCPPGVLPALFDIPEIGWCFLLNDFGLSLENPCIS